MYSSNLFFPISRKFSTYSLSMQQHSLLMRSQIVADELRMPKGIAEDVTLLDRQKQVTRMCAVLD